MDSLLQLLIYLLVAGVVIYVIQLLLAMLVLPAQVKTIIMIVIGLVFLIWILRTLNIFVL